MHYHPLFRPLLALTALALCAFIAPVSSAQDTYEVQRLNDTMIPMRDGVKLAADLYIPKGEGPFPVILSRTPYGKTNDEGTDNPWAQNGYVVVVQDCRGTGNSQGEWVPILNEREDGIDTHKWILEQPWCNGSIGTTGASYVGYTQWITAPLAGDYLKCMFTVAPMMYWYKETTYIGGAFSLGTIMGWGSEMLRPTEGEGAGIDYETWDINKAYRYLPLSTWDTQFGFEVPWMRDWIAHPTYDEYWQQAGIRGRLDTIKVPTLNITGWFDIFTTQALDTISALREDGKKDHHLIIGPWGHGVNWALDELDHGDHQIDLGELEQQWFNKWLKGKDTDADTLAPYRIFVMGRNEWRDEQEWPLARTQYTPFYLHSGGSANSLNGDGTLSLEKPGNDPTDQFTYDPDNPVPTHGGSLLFGDKIGSYDQREIAKRDDVLVYTSQPLENELEVTGPIKVVLHASTDARDTDWTAKLLDVFPDGRAFNLCDGVIRARRRDLDAPPTLIEPGKIYEYEIDLWATSNVFLPGHRIRIEISSSNFPRLDRNPNTGNPFGTDAQLKTANQTIYHNTPHPSHILLPVIPPGTAK